MHARLVKFGLIEIDGQHYDYDVSITAGKITKRKKKPSKVFRSRYNHTPLSADEPIPWGGEKLIVGTGVYGALPIMEQVYEEANRRGIEIVTAPTGEACRLLETLDDGDIYAILHITC
ncbi:MAG: hypothetical protein JXJ17_01105 [Anaerolineae bacterium]|nr:hypothetical protein [Anaerolineae bacterium]